MSGPTGALATAFYQASGYKPPFFQDPYSMARSPIAVVLSWIYYLPLQHRKAILDFCRIQAPVQSNQALRTTFDALPAVPCTFYGADEAYTLVLTTRDITAILDNIWSSPTLCSLLSYFTRAEGTVHRDAFEAEKDASLDKELLAALDYETRQQVLNYTFLADSREHLHPQLHGTISERLVRLYDAGLQRISQHFARYSTPPILPAYNARKNVSYATIRNYYMSLGVPPFDDGEFQKDVTTLDLLKLYYRTGIRVSGPLEVRQAWFFNDLKPRTYYCLGGDAFFDGIFIQEVANLFCEILPSTHPFTRFTVSRVGSLSYDELLVTYDYSSFTTSLAELKYFLFWLAERVRGVKIQVLDVREGIQDLDLGDMLHSYNDAVNRHQAFSIERFHECEERYVLRQGRNGSLGVKGNIVFSTTLHGLALADITGTPDDDCCVGDDALARIRAWFITIFIRCVNNLGDINPEKFTTISRPQEEESSLDRSYKFLKRPLRVESDGSVVLGRLDFFPSVADALFPDGDGIHTTTPGASPYLSAKTFAMQWGRFLTLHCADVDLIQLAREEDLLFLLGGIQQAYRKYGLPLEGGIPGAFSVRWKDTSRDGDFFCPPADTIDSFTTKWLYVLLTRFAGETFTEPVTVAGTILPPLSITEGQTFVATTAPRYLQLCVDLGILEKKIHLRQRVFDWTAFEEYWQRFTGEAESSDDLLLCTYTVLEVPAWWSDLVMFDYPALYEEDPRDAYDRVSSILGGSEI